MNPIDWVIVAVVALSVLLGVMRGFVREVMSLAGWVAGIWLAVTQAPAFGRALPFDLPWPGARTALAALLIVLACLVAAAIVAWIVGKFLSAVKLSGTDRFIGALFGLLRAMLVLALLTFFGSRTALAQQPLWRESVLLPHVEAAVRLATPLLKPLPATTGSKI